MSLTRVDDVRRIAPQIDMSDRSRLPAQDVQTWIEDAERDLYSILDNLDYIMPIDPVESPIGARIVADIVAHVVLARILERRVFGVGDPASSGATEARAYAEARLGWLIDPKYPYDLPDVPRRTNVGIRVAPMFGGFDEVARRRVTMRDRF